MTTAVLLGRGIGVPPKQDSSEDKVLYCFPLGPVKSIIYYFHKQTPSGSTKKGKAWMSGVLSGGGGQGNGSREKWEKSGKGRRKKNTIGLKLARILPKAHSKRK